MNRNVECAYNPENTPIGQSRSYEENSAPLIKPGAVRQILKKYINYWRNWYQDCLPLRLPVWTKLQNTKTIRLGKMPWTPSRHK